MVVAGAVCGRPTDRWPARWCQTGQVVLIRAISIGICTLRGLLGGAAIGLHAAPRCGTRRRAVAAKLGRPLPGRAPGRLAGKGRGPPPHGRRRRPCPRAAIAAPEGVPAEAPLGEVVGERQQLVAQQRRWGGRCQPSETARALTINEHPWCPADPGPSARPSQPPLPRALRVLVQGARLRSASPPWPSSGLLRRTTRSRPPHW
jgi:hypothetical protein